MFRLGETCPTMMVWDPASQTCIYPTVPIGISSLPNCSSVYYQVPGSTGDFYDDANGSCNPTGGAPQQDPRLVTLPPALPPCDSVFHSVPEAGGFYDDAHGSCRPLKQSSSIFGNIDSNTLMWIAIAGAGLLLVTSLSGGMRSRRGAVFF